MTTRSITQMVPQMHLQQTRTRRGAWPRLGALVLVTFLVAMTLLPVATTGVAAEEDEPIIVEIVPQEEILFELEDDPVVGEIVDDPVFGEIADDPIFGEIVDDPELDPDALAEIPDFEIEPSPEIDPGALDEIPEFDLPDDPAPGEVTVFKYDCPAGIDLEFVSQEQLLSECTAVMEGVAFHLVTEPDDQVQVTNASGEAYWPDVPTGSFSLSEEIPAGYSDPFVFCGWGAIVDGVAYDGIVPFQLAAGGTLNLEIAVSGFSMGCYWFNIPYPDEDDGEVVVVKFDCLEGTDPNQLDLEYFGDQCTDKMNGVGFHLSAGGGYEVSATTGDTGNGQATWTDVPAGPLTLTETIPAGYGDPVVICGSYAIGQVFELIEGVSDGEGGGGIEPVVEIEVADPEPVLPDPFIAPGGAVNWELPAGHRLICFWFNIPLDDDGSITVYKHTCLPGYDPHAVGADPEIDCPNLTNGVTFSLWHGLNPAGEGVTGEAGNGTVFFGGLGSGNYYLVETIPAGIVDLFVACTSAVPSDDPQLGPALAYFEPDVIDGGIDLSLIAGEEIVCHWFNIPDDDPGDDPDGGELIVYKYWCDGLLYTIDTCELYDGSAEFGLQAASGEGDPIFFNTGGDGIEGFYLPATAWSLWEIDREWCRAESDDVDAEGNVVVSDGHTSEVHVFNCGPDKEKEPPVTEFPNTGSGTTAGPEGDPIVLHGTGALLGLMQFVAAALVSIRATGLTPANVLAAARAIVHA